MTTTLPCEHIWVTPKEPIKRCAECGVVQLPSGRGEEDISIYGQYIEKDGKRIEPKDFYNPPSGKTLSTQNIEDIISKSDLWMSLPARPKAQQDKRHLAQAIFNAQKGTE